MTANYLLAQGAAANAFAGFAGSDLLVVDMGIAADTTGIPGLVRHYRIAAGTRDMTQGAAMTRVQAQQAAKAATAQRIKIRCFRVTLARRRFRKR